MYIRNTYFFLSLHQHSHPLPRFYLALPHFLFISQHLPLDYLFSPITLGRSPSPLTISNFNTLRFVVLQTHLLHCPHPSYHTMPLFLPYHKLNLTLTTSNTSY